MTKINFFMPSINGQIISCEYEIKVTLYFSCFVDNNHCPRVTIPVYLVHQLPIDYQLEIQELIDFENVLKKSKMEVEEEENFDNYFNDQQFKKKEDNYNTNYKANNNMNDEEEEDNELSSLEVIEEARKDKIKDNEKKSNNDMKNINVINDNNININEIVNINDNNNNDS